MGNNAGSEEFWFLTLSFNFLNLNHGTIQYQHQGNKGHVIYSERLTLTDSAFL